MIKESLRRLLLTLCLIAVAGISYAQKLAWNVNFDAFFDNREYPYAHARSQTLIGARLAPEIGIAIGPDSLSSRIMAGASWIQPMDGRNPQVVPTLYYRFLSKHFNMSFGLFPRTHLFENAPAVFQFDSLTYYRPNLAGVLLQYHDRKGFAELLLDWRQIQTTRIREAFMVMFNGRWDVCSEFFFGGRVMMNHLARSRNADNTETVTDDLAISPYVGLNLTRITGLDTLTLKVGYHQALERERAFGGFKYPGGILIDLMAEWRFLGLKNTFYYGENLMPFYRIHDTETGGVRPGLGTQLNMGDPFFQSRLYDRLDIYGYIFRTCYVNCMASINFHFTPGKVNLQQQLIVRAYFDEDMWKDRRNLKTRQKLKTIL